MAEATADRTSGPAPPVDLSGDPGRRRTERTIRSLLYVAAAMSILISVAIVGSLVVEAFSFLRTLAGPELFTPRGWFPRQQLFDLVTLVAGSVLITGVAVVIALPLGLGAAIYLAEYARAGVRRTLKPILEVLAGIPSVVIAFFALAVISPSLVVPFTAASSDFNMLTAGLGVGLVIIPLVASVSEDALRSVPAALREASYGLGAQRLTTVTRVVLPAAVSGLIASFILAISRALGETLVVTIVAGASQGSPRSFDLLGRGITLTAAMAGLATGTDQVRGATNAFQSLFFVGLLLFLITVGLNLVAEFVVRRLRQRY